MEEMIVLCLRHMNEEDKSRLDVYFNSHRRPNLSKIVKLYYNDEEITKNDADARRQESEIIGAAFRSAVAHHFWDELPRLLEKMRSHYNEGLNLGETASTNVETARLILEAYRIE